jgi:hypothetical protein
MIEFYIAFSYLMLIGMRTSANIPFWNIIFAPIMLPVLLGRWFSHKF